MTPAQASPAGRTDRLATCGLLASAAIVQVVLAAGVLVGSASAGLPGSGGVTTVAVLLVGLLAVLVRSKLGLALSFAGWALLLVGGFIAAPSGVSAVLTVVAVTFSLAYTAAFHGVFSGLP